MPDNLSEPAPKLAFPSWRLVSSGHSNELTDIVFGDNKFVAVRTSGTILTSDDGELWNARKSGTMENLAEVAYGKGVWVAVGGHYKDGQCALALLCSPDDGLTWRDASSGISNRFLRGVGYGDGLFIAAGFQGFMFRSADGLTWQSMGNAGGSTAYDAVFGEGVWVIPGYHGLISFWRNGSSRWVSHCPAEQSFGSAAYGNGVFVACGGDGIWTSTTGTGSWIPAPSAGLHNFRTVIYAGSQFIAVGGEGRVVLSSDGRNWTVSDTGTDMYLRSIAFGDRRYIAVGNEGKVLIGSLQDFENAEEFSPTQN